MLLATGLIRVPVRTTSTVNATAALFDGQTWVPMLSGKQSDGSPSMGSGLFYSRESFTFSTKRECTLRKVVEAIICERVKLIPLCIRLSCAWVDRVDRDRHLDGSRFPDHSDRAAGHVLLETKRQ